MLSSVLSILTVDSTYNSLGMYFFIRLNGNEDRFSVNEVKSIFTTTLKSELPVSEIFEKSTWTIDVFSLLPFTSIFPLVCVKR